MDSGNLQKFYTFIYDLQFSPCGKYLTACDNFGYISIFSLSRVLDSVSNRNPFCKWQASKSSLYCLASNEKLLFSGGNEGVKGWKWRTIQKETGGNEPLFHFIPPSNQQTEFSDVNGIAVSNENGVLYIASGHVAYSLDIETQQIKETYNGHSDYIHSICTRPDSNQFMTGSEDGTVKIWDSAQTLEAVHTINSERKKSNVKSSQWIGCVTVDSTGEWMVFGGSCSPTMYKLGSMSCATVFDVPQKITTQTAIFTSGRIITGGSESDIRHWGRNGDPISRVPTSLSHVFSIADNSSNSQYEVLAVSGDSSDIDIYTHFGYKAFSLSSY